MKDISICLDIGGTYIKGMVYDENKSPLINQIKHYDALSNQSATVIFDNIIQIMKDLVESQNIKDFKVVFLGIAFPGPFDYKKGVSYIKDLGKFDSLYNLNVKQELKVRVQAISHEFESAKLYFTNDATAFAIGENYLSEAESGAYFTIGTGLGSTFIKDKEIIKGKLGIPENGMIYNKPFKTSIVDDFISSRGLKSISKKILQSELSGRKLAKRAHEGDESALKVFHEFGSDIGKAISPYVNVFKPVEIVFGGQISKSYPYFEKGLKKYISEHINIRISENTSASTLLGLFLLQKETFVEI